MARIEAMHRLLKDWASWRSTGRAAVDEQASDVDAACGTLPADLRRTVEQVYLNEGPAGNARAGIKLPGVDDLASSGRIDRLLRESLSVKEEATLRERVRAWSGPAAR